LLLSSGTPTYHLCALILSAVLAVDCLLRMQWVAGARALLVVFTGLCLITQDLIPVAPAGWLIFAAYPRVYALAAFWLLIVAAQRRLGGPATGAVDWPRLARFAAMSAALVVASAWSLVRHFDGQVAGYAQRLPRDDAGWPAAHPAVNGEAVFFTRMDGDGYVLDRAPTPLRFSHTAGTDVFHPTVAPGQARGWVEVAAAGGSRIVAFPPQAAELALAALPTEVEDATAPVAGSDGRRLAFLRERQGRAQLWLFDRATRVQRPITSADWDVLDVAMFPSPDERVVFSGRRGGAPGLFVVGVDAAVLVSSAPGPAPTLLLSVDRPARYPAVSPDGRRLAYAERERGTWQLWLVELVGLELGARRRLTNRDCNSISPAWRADSKRLVYASDCGRGVGLTTLAELSVE
ncbi:MAG TPA: DPP IV N-terminal domain-containing protein, partial [Vicinamibacterales bacterium]|nr:DPP IV N-terminal domain-containing protein [Vicinamibacterales bacterium]